MSGTGRPLKDLGPHQQAPSDRLQDEFKLTPHDVPSVDKMLYRALRDAEQNIGMPAAQIIRQVLTTWLVRNGYLEQDAMQRLGGK